MSRDGESFDGRASRYCSSCGAPGLEGSAYCGGCGAAIDSPMERSEGGQPDMPVRLTVEYQEKSSRLLLFFKWLITIPFLIIWIGYAILAFIAAFIGFWFILFSGRYPKGLFNFVYGFRIYDVRLNAYFPLLLSDDLPLFWENKAHSVTLQDYPDKLSGLSLILKLISFLLGVATGLAGFIVFFLFIVSIPVWFAILVRGHYPRSLFSWFVGVFEWTVRVSAWEWLLRDEFSLFGTTTRVRVFVVIGLLLIGVGSISNFCG